MTTRVISTNPPRLTPFRIGGLILTSHGIIQASHEGMRKRLRGRGGDGEVGEAHEREGDDSGDQGGPDVHGFGDPEQGADAEAEVADGAASDGGDEGEDHDAKEVHAFALSGENC